MAWETSFTLSVIGSAFLLSYIAFNIDVSKVEDQFLRAGLIIFSIILSFISIGANFGILSAVGVPLTESSRMMATLRSVYIPYIVVLILLLVYILWYLGKSIYERTKEAVKIKSGEINE